MLHIHHSNFALPIYMCSFSGTIYARGKKWVDTTEDDMNAGYTLAKQRRLGRRWKK